MPTRSSTLVPPPVFGRRTLNFLAFAGVLVCAWYSLVLMGLRADPIEVLRHPTYDLENLLSVLGWGAHAVLLVAGLVATAKFFVAVWRG